MRTSAEYESLMVAHAAVLMKKYKDEDHWAHESVKESLTWGSKCDYQKSGSWTSILEAMWKYHDRDTPTAQEAEAERLANVAAHAKAFDLLKSVLSFKQKKELDKKGYFHVHAQDRRKYRLYLSVGHNVELVKGGKILKRYCLVPKVTVPTPDKVLAQKLLLEADVKTFLKLANAFDP